MNRFGVLGVLVVWRCLVVWYSLAPCTIRDSRTKSLGAFDTSSPDRAPAKYERRSCHLEANKFADGSGAHGRNGRDPAVDQEVCPDDVRRIVRREVNCQLRDFQRIGDPFARIVGS